MLSPLHRLYPALFFAISYLPLQAQAIITTAPLATTSICVGTTLTVSFTQIGLVAASNTYTVQLGSPGDFINLPTTNPPTFDLATGQYTLKATLPASTTAGSTYRVRVVASNPTTVGSVSSTTLTVRTPPGAPMLAIQAVGPYTYQYTFCQNDSPVVLSDLVQTPPDNYRIQYDVGNGLPPTVQKSLISPTIATATPGKVTYNVRFVVIDDKKGCSPPEQTGSVSFLQVEVKPRPALPSVSTAALTYCQNQTPHTLVASVFTPGSDLVWYDPNGATLTGTSPLPTTSQPGTLVYKVLQSLDRCDGPPASVTVTVAPAAATPNVPSTQLTLCRGAATSPLQATGANLIWTDPNGLTSTAAPTPPTINVSKNTDGDVYYVASGNANGCTSQRVAIRVIVQAAPTLALTGSTTANLGQEVLLKLAFTGVGPYRFTLSNGLNGTAQHDTSIVVLPTRTTTYQVTDVSNVCGTGLPISAATITVQTPTIKTNALSSSTLCVGASLLANFQTTGSFNAGSTFRLQMARAVGDTASVIYSELGNLLVGNGQISGTIPTTATAGTYWVRVVATNPKIPVNGSVSPMLLTVQSTATASFSATPNTIVMGETAKLALILGGSSPWTFAYRDSTDVLGTLQTVTTTTSPYLIDVKPLKTTTYRLENLSNACGASNGLLSRTVITVTPVLAVDPLVSQVSVFPIPASSSLTVRIDPALLTQPATLELINLAGLITLRQPTSQPTTLIPLDGQAAGLFLLRIGAAGQTQTYRVVKE